MRSPFRERLDAVTSILFDGGTGTELYRRGVPYERCVDELDLPGRSSGW